MVTFRNNNGEEIILEEMIEILNLMVIEQNLIANFSNNENFQRKSPGRNNHNASKLIEKYNNLAREALSTGDKILSENYFQHADHFTRILNEQEKSKKQKIQKILDKKSSSKKKNKKKTLKKKILDKKIQIIKINLIQLFFQILKHLI